MTTITSSLGTRAQDAELRDRLLRPWPRLTTSGIVGMVAIALFYVWGMVGTKASPVELAKGVPNMLDFFRRLTPPQWDLKPLALQTPTITVAPGFVIPELGLSGMSVMAPEILFAILETIQMALIGTTGAVILAFPFGLLAARNTSPHPWVYGATRFVLNANRAVPNLIFALIFVAAVGLGPFGGVMAIMIGAIGFMGKLYAEAIESVNPQQVLAVSATGASRIQTFIYGVIPQALPLVASYALLLFETNIRSATVLGIVGAGGVGFVLAKYMALFQYQKLLGALIAIIVTVTIIDRVSDALRRRIL
ncbi:MAG: phosphonate ABC transporter, permease protein PhnE [Chloroflexota bacterium]